MFTNKMLKEDLVLIKNLNAMVFFFSGMHH